MRLRACISLLVAAASVSTASCGASSGAADDAECRDEAAALGLKMVAVAAILVAGATGVAIPLVGRRCRGRGGATSSFSSSPSAGGAFVLVKAFAAGVILATGFVHMLHDADEALTDPCLPAAPWRRFPFPGFVAMLAALGTLVFDFVGTHMYESKQHSADAEEAAAVAGNASANASGHDVTVALLEHGALVGSVASGIGRDGALMGSVGSGIGYGALMGSVGSGIGGGHNDPMHIVGMRAHAAAHRHSYAHGIGPCDDGHNGHDEEPSQARHVVVSQVRF
jgi:zinc transporter 1/2/3